MPLFCRLLLLYVLPAGFVFKAGGTLYKTDIGSISYAQTLNVKTNADIVSLYKMLMIWVEASKLSSYETGGLYPRCLYKQHFYGLFV